VLACWRASSRAQPKHVSVSQDAVNIRDPGGGTAEDALDTACGLCLADPTAWI